MTIMRAIRQYFVTRLRETDAQVQALVAVRPANHVMTDEERRLRVLRDEYATYIAAIGILHAPNTTPAAASGPSWEAAARNLLPEYAYQAVRQAALEIESELPR